MELGDQSLKKSLRKLVVQEKQPLLLMWRDVVEVEKDIEKEEGKITQDEVCNKVLEEEKKEDCT
ncbi:hypothetical protein HAX54_017341, partial [Datura stramonium]|nr:hypothetical protein [Datura stramonium]